MKIETPRISGTIALKGGRIDDVSLTQYRVTVDPKSPAGDPVLAVGFAEPLLRRVRLGRRQRREREAAGREHRLEAGGRATRSRVATPVTLTYDNGEGLQFRRTISIDENYLFTVKDDVKNNGAAPVTLYPFALISRHGTPHIEGFYILHEGLIGVLGDKGLQEFTYNDHRGEEVGSLQGHQRLARHHRQVLGRDAAAGSRGFAAGALLVLDDRNNEDLPDGLPARRADDRAGRER